MMAEIRARLSPVFPGGPAAIRRCILAVLAAVILTCQLAGPAEGSEWTIREFAKFRFSSDAATADASGKILIGLKVELAPGWQFYFKNPGRFGVPPKFNWSASRNLAKVSVHWPQPTRFTYAADPPISTLGYKGSLLLPIVLELANPDDEAELELTLEYAVCNDICVIDTVVLRRG